MSMSVRVLAGACVCVFLAIRICHLSRPVSPIKIIPNFDTTIKNCLLFFFVGKSFFRLSTYARLKTESIFFYLFILVIVDVVVV